MFRSIFTVDILELKRSTASVRLIDIMLDRIIIILISSSISHCLIINRIYGQRVNPIYFLIFSKSKVVFSRILPRYRNLDEWSVYHTINHNRSRDIQRTKGAIIAFLKKNFTSLSVLLVYELISGAKIFCPILPKRR